MVFLNILALLIIILAFIVIATFLVVLFGLNMIYINIRTRVPWVKVPSTNLEKILTELDLPTSSLVYDLGCGDGRFLFLAEKKGLKALGYELAFYPYLKTQLIKFIKGSQIKIIRQDFFKQDLQPADAIFIFLTASVMGDIGKKLKQNLRPDTKVISYGFAIPGWPVKKILETAPSRTYIYTSAS